MCRDRAMISSSIMGQTRNYKPTLQEIHSLPTENSVGNINNSVGN